MVRAPPMGATGRRLLRSKQPPGSEVARVRPSDEGTAQGPRMAPRKLYRGGRGGTVRPRLRNGGTDDLAGWNRAGARAIGQQQQLPAVRQRRQRWRDLHLYQRSAERQQESLPRER